jgi:hypothetical protein
VKLKMTFSYTFPVYVCSKCCKWFLWYMDIVKNGFNTVNPKPCGYINLRCRAA